MSIVEEDVLIRMAVRITRQIHSVVRQVQRHDVTPEDIAAEKPIEACIGKQPVACFRLNAKRNIHRGSFPNIDRRNQREFRTLGISGGPDTSKKKGQGGEMSYLLVSRNDRRSD
jgi:hypothetical protein